MKIYTTKAGDDFFPSAYNVLCRQVREKELSKAHEWLEEDYEEIVASEYSREKLELYRAVLEETENVLEYPEYLENVQNPKSGMLARLHASAYDKRKQERQKAEYQKLGADGVTFTASRGLELYFKTDLGDALFFFLIVLLALGLVVREYEENMLSLIACSYMGKRRLLCCKYLIGIIHIVIFQLVMQFGKLFLYTDAYHFTGWEQRVQSVNGFAQCSFAGTIGEFLVIFIGMKILAGVFLFSLLFLICANASSPLKSIVMVGIICGFFLWCTVGIEENSWLSLLKKISPFQMLCTMELMVENQYLNILGIPVRLSAFWQAVSVVLSGLFFLGSSILFQKEQGKMMQQLSYYGHIKWQSFQKKREVLRLGKGRRGCLLRGLSYRIWKRCLIEERGLVVLILTGAFVFLSFRQIEPLLETEKQYYQYQYIQELQGDYTEEKSRWIVMERQRLEGVQTEIAEKADVYTESAMGLLKQESKKYAGLQETADYVDYLKGVENGVIVYEPGFKVLLGMKREEGYLFECNVLALFLMALLSVALWGREEWNGMVKLIDSSQTGRKRYHKKQGIVLIWYAVVIFMIVYVPWIYNVISGYGLSGWGGSLRSLQIFAQLPESITIGEMCFAYYMLHFIYLLLVGGIAKIMQKKVISQAVATIITFGVSLLIVLWIE